MKNLLRRGIDPFKVEKFIQELTWRDYWQQVWIAKKDAIDSDLKQQQPDVTHHGIPKAIVRGKTGIHAIDRSISKFYETGYLHNHMRMYIAAMACNIGKSHWKIPARWMYFHLLDADWASNALSWQWVAGSNSHKKYVMNQENINKFAHSRQKDTFLDKDYASIQSMSIPDVLRESTIPDMQTKLPSSPSLPIEPGKSTLVYNMYNLDPAWRREMDANRILLLEPSVFSRYPVSSKTIDFIIQLSANIPGIQIFTGEFNDFIGTYRPSEVYFKEHPLNRHYAGREDPREWMFDVTGYYPSFFAFWKKCRKILKHWRGEHDEAVCTG